MKITVKLSEASINNAIQRLKARSIMFDEDFEALISILTEEGAEVAQAAYGDWPVEAVAESDGTHGEITVIGDMPMIAEFGAGDATVSGGFENTPAEARPGSYSEQHAQQYSKHGFWHFGGERFTEVPPHQGLLNAKQYIIDNSTDIAIEVMAHD